MLQGWMLRNYCDNYNNNKAATIMMMIKLKQEDVVFSI